MWSKNDIFNVSSDLTWLFFEPINLKTISFIQNELLKWALFKAKADELEKVKKELAEANARIKELEKENAELTEKYTKE